MATSTHYQQQYHTNNPTPVPMNGLMTSNQYSSQQRVVGGGGGGAPQSDPYYGASTNSPAHYNTGHTGGQPTPQSVPYVDHQRGGYVNNGVVVNDGGRGGEVDVIASTRMNNVGDRDHIGPVVPVNRLLGGSVALVVEEGVRQNTHPPRVTNNNNRHPRRRPNLITPRD